MFLRALELRIDDAELCLKIGYVKSDIVVGSVRSVFGWWRMERGSQPYYRLRLEWSREGPHAIAAGVHGSDICSVSRRSVFPERNASP